ncbi:beta-ketoacyl synthase N-terminal-like domain-containing protein [Streptomyces iconiensis]|uniref:Beta-ketoacyl synthase N-terminal-like domain-containing protein n=1 Tax=Streptomyces iconiensis TaxID=1384038 RepID=A0ABT7A5E3_9ACTN|nr:beta-ketoacyl synthase N-terminal-like domain-containing protein [Streptomyces iconiensis]MDJ1136544.1 beta-ketoacyl synthase N-terminal-like domain-containing protein [Streptomyces iconiensis]
MTGDIVISGTGLVTPFGHGVPAFWDGLTGGRSALRPAGRAFSESYDGAPVGEVPGGGPAPGNRKRAYARAAVAEALAATGRDRLPAGTLLVLAGQAPAPGGAGEGEGEEPAGNGREGAHRVEGTHGVEGGAAAEVLGPPASVAAPLADGVPGPGGLRVVHLSHACASALFAVGFARDMLRAGQAPLAVVAASSVLNPYEYASMEVVRAISGEAARPFDTGRSGISLGEGGGALVLEPAAPGTDLRGPVVAGVACRVAGGKGAASDAAVIASGMRGALDDASADGLGHVHAHATGTPQGDAAELEAVETIARERGGERLALTSHKGAIGHLLHASGVPALVAAAMTLRTGIVPPSAGLSSPEPVDRVRLATAPLPVPGLRTCAVNSLGFGGNNATVVLRGAAAARH